GSVTMPVGCLLVLGYTGRNLGSGMTWGTAYVLDEQETFPRRFNPALVAIERVGGGPDSLELRRLVAAHAAATGSPRAQAALEDWERWAERLWKVTPCAVAEPPPAH